MGEKRGVFWLPSVVDAAWNARGGLLLHLPSLLYSSVLPRTSSSCVGDGREGTSPTAGSTPDYLWVWFCPARCSNVQYSHQIQILSCIFATSNLYVVSGNPVVASEEVCVV